jgi:hypothetical protein
LVSPFYNAFPLKGNEDEMDIQKEFVRAKEQPLIFHLVLEASLE